MATSIYISNERIDIVQGSVKSKKIVVKNVIDIPITEGAIINGVITDEFEITQKLKEAFDKNPSLDKNILLTVDSGSIYVKKLTVPALNVRKLRGIIKDNFSEIEGYEDFLYDFATLDMGNKKDGVLVLACAVEKDLIESYYEIFKKLDIKIKKINISHACAISLISKVGTLLNDTFVISILDKNNMSNILFVNGVYSYSNRTRLVEQRGSEACASEIFGNLSSLIQFNKSEKNGTDIESFYFCGANESEKGFFDMLAHDLERNVSEFKTQDNIIFRDKKSSAAEHFYAIGNLI